MLTRITRIHQSKCAERAAEISQGLTLCTAPRNTLNVADAGVRSGLLVLNKADAGEPEVAAMLRVFSKEPGKATDLHKPFVLPAGSTVADLARLIHRDLPETMKFARLWGHSRFEGRQVHKTDVLCDQDVVEIHE